MQQRLEQMLRLALGVALLGAQLLEFVDDIVSEVAVLFSPGLTGFGKPVRPYG
jgi:hypothetical protein